MPAWRYRCPKGHSNWESRNGYYRCESCGEYYDQLIDWKTKQPKDTIQ